MTCSRPHKYMNEYTELNATEVLIPNTATTHSLYEQIWPMN